MTHGGAYYAIVCDDRDPLGIGRIRVKLPWLASDTGEARWAQLSTPLAGDRSGWRATPAIDDVVVVMFAGGDMARPIVLGGVWSSADAAPEPNADGSNAFRGYCSRGGHRLVLDDSPHAKLVLAGRGGALIAAGAFAAGGCGPNACDVPRPQRAGCAGVAFATPRGDVEVVASGTLRIDAGRDIAVTAATAIDVAARERLAITGTTAAVTARGTASVDAPELELG